MDVPNPRLTFADHPNSEPLTSADLSDVGPPFLQHRRIPIISQTRGTRFVGHGTPQLTRERGAGTTRLRFALSKRSYVSCPLQTISLQRFAKTFDSRAVAGCLTSK